MTNKAKPSTIDLIKKYKHIFGTDWTQDVNCQLALAFNEGSGTTVEDLSQNSNAGNFKGDGEPSWGSAGKPKDYIDYYVTFDGVDDYINCGHDTSLENHDPYTYVAWINPDTEGEGGGGNVFNKGDKTRFWISEWNTNAIRGDEDFVTTNLVRVSANNEITLDTWQHIALRRTGSNYGNYDIFVDGVEASYQQGIHGGGAEVSDAGEDLLIGNNPAGDRTFKGSICECAEFDKYLDSSDINEIMDNGLGEVTANPYPVAWLRKDKPTGYACFLNQYIKAKVEGLDPLKLPDGTTW